MLARGKMCSVEAHFLCRHSSDEKFLSRRSLVLSLLGLLGTIPAFGAKPDAEQLRALARLQVPFVENRGQLDRRVAFSAQTLFGAVFVTRDGKLVYSFPATSASRDQNQPSGGSSARTLTESIVGGNPAPAAGRRAATGVSYFLGTDPRRWQSDLPTYEEIRLGEAWKGVRVSLRAHGGNVEKVFAVMPGARAETIRLRFDGATSLWIDPHGALVVGTGNGDVRFSPPVAYQERDGVRYPVTADYVVHRNSYGFRLQDYDRAIPVVIDPLLQSTYLGGNKWDRVNSIAVHPRTREVLIAGFTDSASFPGTAGGAQPAFGGGPRDVFVARLDPTLTSLLQATYLGGASSADEGEAIAIDPTAGDIIVGGVTASTDFPGTAGGAQPASGGCDEGFVARLNPTLTFLLQATYLGTNRCFEFIWAVAVHPTTGEIVVAGGTESPAFPGTAGGAQPTFGGGGGDVFVARFNSTLTTLQQATYLGGGGVEDPSPDMAADPTTGDIVVAGLTGSTDFPGTAGGSQPARSGNVDVFVARLNSTLTTLQQATYLGGTAAEAPWRIALHPLTREILVAGQTSSTDFPHTAGGAQPALGGGGADGFVARLNPALTSLLQATYLGGRDLDGIEAIGVHPTTGDVLVAGLTLSTDFPGTAGGVRPTQAGNWDAFVARLDSTLTRLHQASYLGGTLDDGAHAIAVDPLRGDVLVAGGTSSNDFPGASGGAQSGPGGEVDAFVSRLTSDLAASAPPPERLPILPVPRSPRRPRSIPPRQ
jgi:hypothetical protein